MQTFICISEEDNIVDFTEAQDPQLAVIWFHNKYKFTEGTKLVIAYEMYQPLNNVDDPKDIVLQANAEQGQIYKGEITKKFLIKNGVPIDGTNT
jgi:hypothetical protein